jgi:hypothetical protein
MRRKGKKGEDERRKGVREERGSDKKEGKRRKRVAECEARQEAREDRR